MLENRRDAGLVRAVGIGGFSANIINAIVGAGIFTVPASLGAAVGSYAPFAFLVCAVAIGAVAICFAEGGSRIPTSGGAYGYIEAAFGPLAGYVAGTLLWFSNALASGGLAAALADTIVTLVPPSLRALVHTALIVAVVGGIAFVNLGGVIHGTRLVKATTWVKLIPLILFVVIGAFATRGENFDVSTTLSANGFGRAMILALFAFTGMEISLCASGEVARPARTIPRALAIATLVVTVLYIAIQVVAQGLLGPALATSSAPLADAMAQIHPSLRLLLLAGAAVSILGVLTSDILGTPRVLFAFARDGLMPRVLGRMRERSAVPHVAILSYALLVMILALTSTFAELAVLSTLTVAVPYIGGCAAAWRLARRGVAMAGTPLNFRWLGAAAVVGIVSMLAMIALAAPGEIAGLVILICISAIVYILQTKMVIARRPA